MKPPIYLDYAATTPLDERVTKVMQACLEHTFGNSSSPHAYGEVAKHAIDQARSEVADLIHADPSELIWTSGATEANNLALKGAAALYQRKGKHIITLKTEHKAVLDTCQHLEKEGYLVTYLSPESNGLLDLDKLTHAIRPDTILVSMMHVNNETGVIQDIASVAELTSTRSILLHVDAAQSVGKIPLDLAKIPADLVSMCAHKIYGPKGIGALYIRKKPRVRVAPLIHGGGHEQGMRSGTLATHQIVGMGKAFALAKQEMDQDYKYIHQLRKLFLDELLKINCVQVNIDLAHCVPHILNLRFAGMLAKAVLAEVPNIAVSTSSACQGKGTEGSYVLRAMGLSPEHIKSSVRFSFGRFTTKAEIDYAIKAIHRLFQ